jgi:hypothetical protein
MSPAINPSSVARCFHPVLLARKSCETPLFVSKLQASTSLYKTRMEYFGRFVNGGKREVSYRDYMAQYFVPLSTESQDGAPVVESQSAAGSIGKFMRSLFGRRE